MVLRSRGEDGRFIELRGIRDLEGELRVGDILARSEVELVAGAPAGLVVQQAVLSAGATAAFGALGG